MEGGCEENISELLLKDCRNAILSRQSEFEDLLQPSQIMDFIPSLPEGDRERIMQLENCSRRAAVSQLIEIVVESNAFLNEFINALDEQGYDKMFAAAQGQLSVETLCETEVDNKVVNASMTREYYEFLMKHIKGQLVQQITPSHILPDLVSLGCIGPEDMECISAIEQSQGHCSACREMFKRLPRKKAEWSNLFFEALQRNHKHVLRKMDPSEGFKNEVNEVSETVKNENIGPVTENIKPGFKNEVNEVSETVKNENISPVTENIKPDVDTKPELTVSKDDVSTVDDDEALEKSDDEDEDEEMDIDEDYLYSDQEKEKKEASEKSAVTGEKKSELNLRAYQLELAAMAETGENDIICSGTGSGKTRVSVHIIKNHMKTFPREKLKVAFFARTVPLVGQQYKVIKKHLPEYKVLQLTGDDEKSRYLNVLLSDYDIIVLTPQLLENDLKNGKIASISMFSLLVFDECHHTQKGEPYNSIMKRYLKLKYSQVEHPIPQILGLTASIGVAKATTKEEAVASILSVCANMDVAHISTVEKNLKEYEEIVAIPNDYTEPLDDREYDPVKVDIIAAMEKVEKMLLDPEVMSDGVIQKLLQKIPTGDRASQTYHQWTILLEKSLQRNVSHDANAVLREALTCNRILRSFNRALEVNELLRTEDVIKYMWKDIKLPEADKQLKTDKILNDIFKEVREKLNKHLKDPKCCNPNLDTLLSCLRSHSESTDDSRFIVFVCTRAAAMALSDFLNNNNFRCSHFTGAGPKEEEGGMTKPDQDRIIANLKDGSLNGIVSTSVGEEGIDIPDCNLILRYNHVGNEISTVQTRGRSRKKGGKSILLAKSKILDRETINVRRSSFMKEAVNIFKSWNRKRVDTELKKIQDEILKDEEIKELIHQDKVSRKRRGEFHLICGRCFEKATDGDSIRSIRDQHHVIVDPLFWGKIDIVPNKKVLKFDNITINSKMMCTKCSYHWGEIMTHKNIKFPALKITSFIIEIYETKEQETYKKWIDVPFKVSEISLEDYKIAASRID